MEQICLTLCGTRLVKPLSTICLSIALTDLIHINHIGCERITVVGLRNLRILVIPIKII
jgi:hypothetical protein